MDRRAKLDRVFSVNDFWLYLNLEQDSFEATNVGILKKKFGLKKHINVCCLKSYSIFGLKIGHQHLTHFQSKNSLTIYFKFTSRPSVDALETSIESKMKKKEFDKQNLEFQRKVK